MTPSAQFPIGALLRDPASPEVGPLRVIDVHDRSVTVRYEWRGHTQLIQPTTSHFVRYRLLPGFRIALDGRPGEVEGLAAAINKPDTDALYTYRVRIDGKETTVAESELLPLPAESDQAIEFLRTYSWRGPRRFYRRWNLLDILARWQEDTGGLPSLIGARIRPLAHQIYAVRRVLWDREPRFILADEVGLGKTIEAGLILQTICLDDPFAAILVIAPGSMTRQWQCELYLRFGAQAYRHADLATLTRLAPNERVDYVASPRLVISAAALVQYPEVAEALRSRSWTMVVVDEAHQFPPSHPAYAIIRELSAVSCGFLALSATPSRADAASLAALLALVAPSVYTPNSIGLVQSNIAAQREIWDKLSFSGRFLKAQDSGTEPLNPEDALFLAQEWEPLSKRDPAVAEFLARLRQGDAGAADELVSYVQEFHRFDHRLVRTRRRTTMATGVAWSRRTFESLPYIASVTERQAMAHIEGFVNPEDATQHALVSIYLRLATGSPALLLNLLKARFAVLTGSQHAARKHSAPERLYEALFSAPGSEDEHELEMQLLKSAPPMRGEVAWLRTAIALVAEWNFEESAQHVPCARFRTAVDWITSHLAVDRTRKVLVFSQDANLVEECARYLRERLPRVEVETFHWQREDEELVRAARKFQRDPKCSVLVSDELGGEGRNFQHASAVVHLDTPWFANRIEQRIGRLDRVGRDPNLPVHSVVLAGPMQLEQALIRVHHDAFRVFEHSLGAIEFSLPELQRRITACAFQGTAQLQRLVPELQTAIASVTNEADEAFQVALDTSRVLLSDASEQSDILAEPGNDADVQENFCNWARELGMTLKEVRSRVWEFRWKGSELLRSLPEFATTGADERSFFFVGTFDRELALADESVQFFSAGHTLIQALIRDVASSAEGRATAFSRKLGDHHKGKLFLILLTRTAFNVEAAGEISPGLLNRVRKYQWSEAVPMVYGLDIIGKTCEPVVDVQLLHSLSSSTITSSDRKLTPQELAGAFDVTTIATLVDNVTRTAVETVRKRRAKLHAEAKSRLQEDLRFETAYYNWLARSTDESRATVARDELSARRRLLEAIPQEKVEIEAVALVLGR